MRREKECTYDAVVRRRGPGRKNKSAQETARVQLANRQKEEAERETALQYRARFSRSEVSRAKAAQSVVEAKRHREVSSQTSSKWDRYTRAEELEMQSDQQYKAPEDLSGRRPQEFQAFSIHFAHSPPPPEFREPGTGTGTRNSGGWPQPQPQPEVFPPSMAHQQIPVEHLPYELQTSASPSLGYYTGPLERSRASPSSAQPYAPSGHTRYPSVPQPDQNRHSITDSDSMYAYSEGANVVPSRYEQQPRSGVPARLRQVSAEYREGGAEVSGDAKPRRERRY